MGYGMFTLPQLPNQIMVVSPLTPKGLVYGVDKQVLESKDIIQLANR